MKQTPSQNKILNRLSVVMPVYNEALTLREVVRRIKSVPLPIELIIVDDHSTDESGDILRRMEEEEKSSTDRTPTSPLIRFIFQDRNQGKGACVRRGVVEATGDVLIIQDADLEYNPEEYPKLVEPILNGEADVVYGSRYRGEKRSVLLFWHTVGNKVLTMLSNIFTGLNLSDMETCYKVFKTEIIKSIPIRSRRFGFEPEITAKVAKLRCNIDEVPISYRGRGYSEGKKIGWKDGISAIFTIVRFWLFDDLYEDTAGLRTLRIMEGAGTYNQWLFQQSKPYLGQRILEGGSGIGNITKFLLDRKLVVATEIIDFDLEELKRAFGHFQNVRVQKLDLLDENTVIRTKEQHAPDTVLSMNVLEHIADDKKALQNINKLLEVGGRVILTLPSHATLFSQMDKNLGRFRRYSKATLKKRLEEAGFEIEMARYLNLIGACGWWINGKILRKKLLPTRQVRVFDAFLSLLWLEKFIPPPFGLSILAVARKVR